METNDHTKLYHHHTNCLVLTNTTYDTPLALRLCASLFAFKHQYTFARIRAIYTAMVRLVATPAFGLVFFDFAFLRLLLDERGVGWNWTDRSDGL